MIELEIDHIDRHHSPERALAASVLQGAIDDLRRPQYQRSLADWSTSRAFLFWCNMACLEDGAIERLRDILQGRRKACLVDQRKLNACPSS